MKLKNLLVLFVTVIISVSSCGSSSSDEINYKWELTFEDNFNSLDTNIWRRHFAMGNRTIWSNKEVQWYKDENVTVDNGILKLTAKKESIYGKDSESEKQFEFTSGMINTPNSFKQAYGKWEIRVKFPYRKGYWPAFWLVADQRPGLPEIDIFEYFGQERNKISIAQHWGLDYPNYSGGMYEGKTEPFYFLRTKAIEGKFDDKWMVWSFECFPDRMLWKLDGKTVYESTEGIPTAPMYIIANVAMKDWTGKLFKDDGDVKPYVMEIDYIRAYKMVPKGD